MTQEERITQLRTMLEAVLSHNETLKTKYQLSHALIAHIKKVLKETTN